MKFMVHAKLALGDDYKRLKALALMIIYAYIMAIAGLYLSYEFPIPYVDIVQRAYEVNEFRSILESFFIWSFVAGATVFIFQMLIMLSVRVGTYVIRKRSITLGAM